MGPPSAPAVRRQSLAGGPTAGSRTTATPSRTPSGQQSFAPKPRLGSRPAPERKDTTGVQSDIEKTSDGSGPDTEDGPPKAISPVLSRTAALDRQHASPTSTRGTSSPMTQRSGGASTVTSRELEDLKAKLRVMEKKRMEDRDKLKAMEQMKSDRDKFESAFQKLKDRCLSQQDELKKLRQDLSDAEARFDAVETMQGENETLLEMAILDKDLAEEVTDNLKHQRDELKEELEEAMAELELLRLENEELGGEMSTEEKTSKGWLQMERSNERLREALMRLRDMTQQTESDLKENIKILEQEIKELTVIKEQHEETKKELTMSKDTVSYLQQQLQDNEVSDDMILSLTDKKFELDAKIEDLEATIEDLKILKELNDELEINHVEVEKEMQEDIDFKESIIHEQARRSSQQELAIENAEYTLSRFRELVTNLQSDIKDMQASHAVTETESEQLNSRSRAMMDLNMKLQVSAAKTQLKTIDLELRRLDAQEASEHLAIVQLFLPEAFQADRDSVLALLRFKRVAFKANLLHGFVKERVNGTSGIGHEDDIFAACDILDKLSWVSAMCDRFVNAISHCSIVEFSKYEGALYELEPVERALNGWIDGLRRDELKEKQCANELQRTIALMSHLSEVHISDGLASYADDIHMRTVVMQSRLDNAASALSIAKTMVETIIPSQGDEDELAEHFTKKTEHAITQTRSAKVIVGKAVRALEDLKSRSLSLTPDTIQSFEQCEASTQELAVFSRQMGVDLHALLHEEGKAEPFTYFEVQSTIYSATSTLFASSESDILATYLNKVRVLTASLVELAAMASDLEMTEEFERSPAPWVIRSHELKSSKAVPVDAEEELRRLREDNHERATLIAIRDQTLEESAVKIELLESRMRDATKKNERINELERRIEEAKQREALLNETIESHSKELTRLEADGETWKKIAEDNKSIGAVAPGSKAVQERAVATAREMEALKTEIASLQAAVRYLKEDNRRARLTDYESFAWLDTPLTESKSKEEQRKDLVVAEANDVFNELLNLTKTATVYDLSRLPKNRLGWKPAKVTPQYHVAKQREGFEEWNSWRLNVERKGRALINRDANKGIGIPKRAAAAKVKMHLPSWEKVGAGGREVEIVDPEDWGVFRGRLGFV